MDIAKYQVHLYCREPDDFEDFLLARDADFGVRKAKADELADGELHPERLHLYSRSGRLFAVDLDGTKQAQGEGVALPTEVLDKLTAAFPLWHIPKADEAIPPAPFGVEMLEALNDF
jgi:hypothetical protein